MHAHADYFTPTKLFEAAGHANRPALHVVHRCAVPCADLVALQRHLVGCHLDHDRLKQRRDDVCRDQVRLGQYPGIAHWPPESVAFHPIFNDQVANMGGHLSQSVLAE
jgi:hypothetical protein